MYFKQIYDEDLAQSSYVVGCQQTGEAVVVDPRRDVQVYLEQAEREGLKIVAVTETHIHADYLSGSRELAEASGATLYLSGEGGEGWTYGFAAEKLYHGSELRLGNVRVRAVHTPGHTPEHLSFLITDGATAEEPGFFLTGDFVFVGDVGRPDLLDEALGGQDTRFEGAKQLFRSLKERFWTLPDYVQVWPGHGAGSACGKALGAVPSSTVGYEKQVAWWSAYVREGDEQGFVDELLSGQPDAPSYFGRMKRLNRDGPPLLETREALPEMPPSSLKGRLERELLLIDTRSADAFRQSSVPASLSLPAGKRFATYASYVLDPERDGRGVVLLAADRAQAEALRDKLSYVGIDKVVGFVTSLAGLEQRALPSVPPEKVAGLEQPFYLDVRSASEYEGGHLPGARRIPIGRLTARLAELPRERPVVVYCQSGARAAVATAALRAAGFDNALELGGSYENWRSKQPVSA